MKILLLFSLLYCLSTASSAQTTYFQQDFSAGGTLSNYVDAANPGISKFTGAGVSPIGKTASLTSTVGIVANSLETYRPVDAAGATNAPGDPFLTYGTNFSPEPASFYTQFTLEGLPSPEINTRPNAAVFSVGSGTDYKADATLPDKLQTFTRMYVNVVNNGSTLSWALRWIVNSKEDVSPTYTGKHLITWVLNRAGGQLSYLKPNPQATHPTSETLANGKWDVWVDTTRVFNEIDAINSSIPLLNFKYIHLAGTGHLRLDDFLFRDVSGALPVRLTNFRAVTNGAGVDLNWQLPTPDAGSTFVVERSRDGYEYTAISRHQAMPDQRNFGTTDAEPFPGLSYYRLRHVDASGFSTLTAPIAVQLRGSIPGFNIRNNPGSGEYISLTTSGLTKATYQLTTLAGQPVTCQTNETPDGQVTLQPHRSLTSGVYILTATTGAIRLTRRVLVH